MTPGTYTVDSEQNAASLSSLRALADRHPEMVVHVGHELGESKTGVEAVLAASR